MLHSGQARIRSFRVVPDLPPTLKPLLELAHNLWWTWHPEAVELFKRLDRELWQETYHNPVKLLGLVRQSVLDRAADDQSFLHQLNSVYARFRAHMTRNSWFQRQFPTFLEAASAVHDGVTDPDPSQGPLRIAYFCAEFGLTECFQIYSGGLGCLAGDHLKSASELGVPMCAVGLLYRCGYFHQYLNADGWQQETYPDIDFPNQPIHRLIDPDTGEQYRVTVDLPGRPVTIGVWRCNAGRVPLYLLDTNFPENRREDRDITRTLYGGDIETRIQQEIVLGIGGVRALEKVGEKPTVYHINEGHAAFLALERIARLREQHSASFDEANRAAAAAHVFTTHTPVPAGIDRFAPELIQRYFAPMLPRLGLDAEGLLALGRANVFDKSEYFSMAVLAIRTTNYANAVSKLHGHVSRTMWKDIWPGVPEPEIPIGHVTNGVHARSWISPALMKLFDRYLGPDWQLDPTDFEIWDAINELPDEELWRTHCRQREKLVTWCRKRIRKQMRARGLGHDEVEKAAAALDPDILTIGFARRFATYKRGTLLMQDPERLRAIFNRSDRPLQLLIAGKAHPADGPGKELIRQIVKLASESDHLNRVIFLEDYDIEVARRLVQGCDIWLNTPRRGMEASGTSGMKAAMNGVINLSILDGWYDEAHDSSVGFSIGKGESYDDPGVQDAIESRALYDLLERQILPEFYQRDESGLPRKWIQRMKASIRAYTPRFSTNRMVGDYTEQYYLLAHGVARSLAAKELDAARGLAAQIGRLREQWSHVGIRRVESNVSTAVPVRTPVRVRALVALGGLKPTEVRVQLYHGEVSSLGDMVAGATVEMHAVEDAPGEAGIYTFTGEFNASGSGRRGFTVRVVPRDDRLVGTLLPGLISWYQHDDAGASFAPSSDASRFSATPRPGEPVSVH
ncbi:MAG: alpha-glucan family phosphorylase [Planctomycetota bacterium]|nr:alpha-glucan family phosphorylase [Planctomycetota bacterium]